jgi:hypothetical protein
MRDPNPKILLAGILVGLLSASATAAWGQGLRANVNRTEATIQDQLLLTLTVSGSQEAIPRLPELPDFEVYSGSRSSQMQIANGRTSVNVSYSYSLVPKKTGNLLIGPATVEIDGRSYSSQPIRVRIVEASQEPQENREVFVTAKVSTTQPYVGQQVIYTWRFYRRVQVGDAQLDQQTFDGVLVEDLGEAKTYQATVNGLQYAVYEIRKALFPQERGPVTVPASRLNLQILKRSRRRGSIFDEVFGNTVAETKVLRTEPIELQVRPLPAAPPGFSGLVGSFSLKAAVSKTELTVGESATLTLTVSGDGNAQMIAEPPLPDLPQFKIYVDKASGGLDRGDNGLSGRRIYRKALLPLTAGELTVPALTLTYFDPDSGSYRASATAPITFTVAPGSGEEELGYTEGRAPTTGKVAVRILADDILPLHRGLDALRRPSLGQRWSPLLIVLLLLPALCYLVLALLQRRRSRFAADGSLRRRVEARKKARKALAALPQAANAQAVAQQASLCLRRYIGDKVGLEGSALTPAEAADALSQRRVGEDLVERCRTLLDRLEAAQYGGGTTTVADLAAEISSLIQDLEKSLR